jgi:putative Mg2+ transporter-C (MgtC) family protein
MELTLSPSAFFWTVLVKFAVAAFCGGIIGLDRQLRGKPAGIRTCIVLVVTTTFMAGLGRELTAESGDPSRVLAAIITGVGFLGGGVIFAQGRRVQGMTTATLIWALAAIGTAIGLGFGHAAIVMSLLIILVLKAVDWAEARFPRLHREFDPRREDGRE